MRDVIIKRAWADDRATLGMLTINDVQHDPFFTLENPMRETPVDSRIRAGLYKCQPYSGTKFKDVYILNNVPGRETILIHWGNFEADTLGCIIIGNGACMLGGKPAVADSRAAFDRFRAIIGERTFNLMIV